VQALDPPAQAKIVSVDGFGLGMMTRLQQQRGQRVARRMHPSPWLGVVETVVPVHGLAETRIGLFVVTLVVRDLTVEHGFGHAQGGVREVAQEFVLRRYAGHGFAEERAFAVSGDRVLERRVGDAARIMMHRDRDL